MGQLWETVQHHVDVKGRSVMAEVGQIGQGGEHIVDKVVGDNAYKIQSVEMKGSKVFEFCRIKCHIR